MLAASSDSPLDNYGALEENDLPWINSHSDIVFSDIELLPSEGSDTSENCVRDLKSQ